MNVLAKSVLMLIFIFLTGILSSSRSEVSASPLPGSDWILDQTVGNVDFYYKIVMCEGFNTIVLKFNNKNTGDVKIAWKEVIKTQYEETVSPAPGMKEIILKPGETSEDNCNDVNSSAIIRVNQISPAYPAEIKDFRFSDISVIHL